MKVLKRLKSPSKQTHYKPLRKIIITRGMVNLLSKMGITPEQYARARIAMHRYGGRYN